MGDEVMEEGLELTTAFRLALMAKFPEHEQFPGSLADAQFQPVVAPPPEESARNATEKAAIKFATKRLRGAIDLETGRVRSAEHILTPSAESEALRSRLSDAVEELEKIFIDAFINEKLRLLVTNPRTNRNSQIPPEKIDQAVSNSQDTSEPAPDFFTDELFFWPGSCLEKFNGRTPWVYKTEFKQWLQALISARTGKRRYLKGHDRLDAKIKAEQAYKAELAKGGRRSEKRDWEFFKKRFGEDFPRALAVEIRNKVRKQGLTIPKTKPVRIKPG